MTKTNTKESAVLYYTSLQNAQNNNNPSPLEFTYHSPSTRHLSSLLPTSTTPEPSTITEIDSAYCPQSLVSWDANRAFHISSFSSSSSSNNNLYDENSNDDGQSSSMGEVSCPICESVLMLTIQESKLFPSLEDRDEEEKSHNDSNNKPCTHLCMYKCGYCQWDSYDELKIYSKINMNMTMDTKEEEVEDGEEEKTLNEKEKVEKATKDVQSQLYKTMIKRKQSTIPFMNAVINKWNEQFKLEEMNKRKTEMLISKPTPTISTKFGGGDDFGNNRGGSNTSGGIANTCSILNTKDLNSKTIRTTRGGALWSVEELDASIIQKKNYINEQVKESIFIQDKDKDSNTTTTKTTTLSRLSIKDLSSTSSIMSNKSQKSFRPSNQCTISTNNTKEEQILIPAPVKLRTRAIKRDYKESSLGKPGILVKPKVNPLEGDSSYRRHGQGQWWKKDSSAIHTIPKIVVHKQSFDEESKQYALLLRVSNPTLGLIRLKVHTNFPALCDNKNDNIDGVSSFPSTYQNLVVSSFPLKLVQSKVIPPNNNPNKMKSVTLEPIEDAFLELGGMSGNVDKDAISRVTNWESNIDWSSSPTGHDKECDCKLVSHQNDVAYVELKVPIPATMNSDSYLSTPLILEIDIGDGSWESSLIQSETGAENDCVSFIVLPTWKQ